MSSPPFFLRDSRASKARARVKFTPREKRPHFSLPAACHLFSRGACVSLALLSQRKNGGLLVVQVRSFKPHQNEHDSVKEAREKGKKKTCNDDPKIPMKIVLHYSPTFPVI